MADETSKRAGAEPDRDASPEPEPEPGTTEPKSETAGSKSEAAGAKQKAPLPLPPRGAVRFANVTIGAAVALSLSQLFFAVELHRPVLLRIVSALMALLFLASFKLHPARRLTLSLVLALGILLVYGFEWRISRSRPYDGTMAERRGNTYDSRSLWEAILDKRASGVEAYPSFQPRALLVLDLKHGLVADEIQNHIVSPEWGVVVDGERVLPFGGLANKHILYCNEGGKYAEYESDEHGFNNPKGIWPKSTLDVALIGDSFTQAACVGQDENAAHWVRQRYPDTLNLGMAGNGPLIELAGLSELIAPKKPKIVLWVYYNNDMGDLDVEKRVPMLMRYLDEEGFSQNLAARQDKIDTALLELSGKIEKIAPRWPGALSAVGLTRTASPMWLGDLAMNESHSATTAVLRLDRLTWGLTSLAVVDVYNVPPDFPLFKRVLAKAKSRVEAWGGKLYFVYMADMFYLQYKGKRTHPNREGVLAAVKELGLPLIDAYPTFLSVPDPLSVRFHPESHCNPAGYKLLSEVMLKGLEEAR